MALKLGNLLSKAVGAVAGGPTQTKLAAAAVAARNKVLDELRKVGEKLGADTGANVFEALAEGARPAADQETERFISDNTGFSIERFKGLAYVAVLLLAVWFLMRGEK